MIRIILSTACKDLYSENPCIVKIFERIAIRINLSYVYRYCYPGHVCKQEKRSNTTELRGSLNQDGRNFIKL